MAADDGGATYYTVEEARDRLPEIRRLADEIIAVRADLVELGAALAVGLPSSIGGLPEAKGLEARLDSLLSDLGRGGVQVKGWAPVLVDFPSIRDGEEVLLCWIEGEPALEWYHRVDLGFAGRRRIEETPNRP